eukprot:1159661_1
MHDYSKSTPKYFSLSAHSQPGNQTTVTRRQLERCIQSPHFAYRPKVPSIQAKATSSPVNAQNNGGGPTHSPVTMQDPASEKPDSDMDIDPSDEEEEMEVDSSASHVRERKRPHSSS